MNSSNMALIQLQGKSVNASSPSSSYPPAAGAAWRPAATVPSASGPARAIWTPGNHSEAYSLSVVQLADPAHAEMMQLNATTSTKASPYCDLQLSIVQSLIEILMRIITPHYLGY